MNFSINEYLFTENLLYLLSVRLHLCTQKPIRESGCLASLSYVAIKVNEFTL